MTRNSCDCPECTYGIINERELNLIYTPSYINSIFICFQNAMKKKFMGPYVFENYTPYQPREYMLIFQCSLSNGISFITHIPVIDGITNEIKSSLTILLNQNILQGSFDFSFDDDPEILHFHIGDY